jgi:Ca2+-transporting ATPase
VNVICSDKTGTLTQNKMTVTRYYAGGKYGPIEQLDPGNQAERLLLENMVLCNDATLAGEEQTGDPTEVALLAAARRHGLHKDRLEAEHGRVNEIPFDSNRKMMTTVNRYGDSYLVMTKGAIDRLIGRALCFTPATCRFGRSASPACHRAL